MDGSAVDVAVRLTTAALAGGCDGAEPGHMSMMSLPMEADDEELTAETKLLAPVTDILGKAGRTLMLTSAMALLLPLLLLLLLLLLPLLLLVLLPPLLLGRRTAADAADAAELMADVRALEAGGPGPVMTSAGPAQANWYASKPTAS